MSYVFAEALIYVFEDLLDDPEKTRWSDASFSRALKPNISSCLEQYLAAGGDRFTARSPPFTTNNGKLKYSAVLGILNDFEASTVQGVHLVTSKKDFGGQLEAKTTRLLRAERPKDATRFYHGSPEVDLQLLYVPPYHVPLQGQTNAYIFGFDTDPLGGHNFAPYPSWDAYDCWVIVSAALDMEAKERDEPSRRLLTLEAKLRRSVMETIPTPRTAQPPRNKYDLELGWHVGYDGQQTFSTTNKFIQLHYL